MSRKMNELNDGEAPLNMAMMYYAGNHEIMMIKSRAAISGDILTYRNCLEELYVKISFQLKDYEKKRLEQNLSLAGESIQKMMNDPTSDGVGQDTVHEQTSLNMLKKIDIDLMRLMSKYHMIFPRIVVKGGLKSVYDKLGLNGSG